jgi:hypothetical protein
MKRNLLGLLAVVLAVAVSSFTVKKTTNVYFVYNSGTQTDRTHYTEQSSASAVDGSDVLAWFRIADDNGTVSNDEFNDAFESLDTVNDSSDTLNDDIEKTITSDVFSYQVQLEKKAS